jgi:heptosyltransferase III
LNFSPTIIISRTDNIGDVVLTLPLVGILKKHFPSSTIYFISKNYTQPIIECCYNIDFFIDREHIINRDFDLANINADYIFFVFPDIEIAKAAFRAKIPNRVGTSHRWFHLLYANKLLHFGRKKSDLHEAQLNLVFLNCLGLDKNYSKESLINFFGWKPHIPSSQKLPKSDNDTFNLILHPKSKGSAREWDLKAYKKLIGILSSEDKYQFWITGTKSEGEKIRNEIPDFFQSKNVIDFTGKQTLKELIALIGKADALIACSTGPLHLAAVSGIHTLGIYPPLRPLHPGRWSPIGEKVQVFVEQKECSDCLKTLKCACIHNILPEKIAISIHKLRRC